MKIGFVIDDTIDSNDGVQQYVRTLGKWLARRGHNVHYLAGQSQKSNNVHSLAKNIRIKFNGNQFSIPLPTMAKKIQALLATEHFDVLHVQMPYSPVLAGKIIKYARNDVAIMGTFHIMPFGKYQAYGNKVLGRLQRRSLDAFDATCFVSPAAQEFAKANYGIKGPVIPNMIDVSAWKSDVKIIPGRVIFLGRLVSRKGCRELLYVLSALPKSMLKKLEIIIAGDGPQRESLEILAQNLNLNVSFYGYIAESEKVKLLASAEIAIFPSLGGESFGIVLLEAMAAGAGVVVGGDNPGYRSVLASMPDCLLDFKATASSAQQLLGILGDNKRRQALHHVQQKLIKTYDVTTIGVEIEALYATVIAKHQQRRDNEHYVK